MTRSTTTTSRDAPLQRPALPPLSAVDRLALRLGTRLILWDERHRLRRTARTDRAEQGRHARRDAERAANRTFERRTWAGPTW